MKIKKITCCICGKQEDASQWIESMSREPTDNQMCFSLNIYFLCRLIHIADPPLLQVCTHWHK